MEISAVSAGPESGKVNLVWLSRTDDVGKWQEKEAKDTVQSTTYIRVAGEWRGCH